MAKHELELPPLFCACALGAWVASLRLATLVGASVSRALARAERED